MISDTLAHLKRVFIPLFVAVVGAVAVSSRAPAAPGGIPGRPDSDSPFSAIYVIGDSMSDTGRTATVLIGFPQYPFNLWIQYFAPMVRQTYNPLDNFSWAGAMTGFTLLEPSGQPQLDPINNVYGRLPGMTNQLIELKSLTHSSLDPKALYVVFGGTNDFLRIDPTGANAASVIAEAINNLFTIVVDLHGAGARNIVVVNVADLGRIPLNLSRGPAVAQLATQFSAQFNHDLDNKLNSVAINTCRVNLFELSRDFTDKPKKYGFTNVTDQSAPDLGKSDTYLFWDQIHPTTRGHSLIAEEIFRAVSKAGMLKPNAR